MSSIAEAVDVLDRQRPDHDPCLFFDQFEELFTLDPTDVDAKREFIAQLRGLLRKRSRWALFSMREDFIAQLDPYLEVFPDRLNTRVRLEMLSTREAVEAIVRPPASLDVQFEERAAERLVDDLRRVQVEEGGEIRTALGPDVEPVQLQIVCRRLWERLPDHISTIGEKDLASAGTVDQALASFYSEEVGRAAERSKTPGEAVRRWFESDLISHDEFRTQTRSGPGPHGDVVLQSLEDSYLIRSDRIRGAKW